MLTNDLTEAQRDYDRTTKAVDLKDTSFSYGVATNVAQWLVQNRGTYDSQVLAQQAIKHAIDQSKNLFKF